MQAKPESRSARIYKALTAALNPNDLVVTDDSRSHVGHVGSQPAGETHFKITAISKRFSNLERVERSRLVHDILKKEFASGLHAVSLTLRSPSESTSLKSHNFD